MEKVEAEENKFINKNHENNDDYFDDMVKRLEAKFNDNS